MIFKLKKESYKKNTNTGSRKDLKKMIPIDKDLNAMNPNMTLIQ